MKTDELQKQFEQHKKDEKAYSTALSEVVVSFQQNYGNFKQRVEERLDFIERHDPNLNAYGKPEEIEKKEPNSEKLNRIIQVLCDIAYKLDVLVSDEYKRTHCYHSRFIYNPDKQKTPDDWNIPRY